MSDSDDEIEPESDARDAWYEQKSQFIDQMLGPEHGLVLHSFIPFAIGGALDLYYHYEAIPGTIMVTKEVSEDLENIPSNSRYTRYELMMATRHVIRQDESGPVREFGETAVAAQIHQRCHRVLNLIARYAPEATLNVGDTLEFPAEIEDVGGACFILAEFVPPIDFGPGCFGILAVIEVFRTEMEIARKQGGALLVERLKAAGHFPYSDMDRKPVA